MSHFTLPIGPRGPLLTMSVGPSAPRVLALQAAGQPVPQAQTIQGLVDTGASCTTIDPAILTALGLAPTGATQVHTPTTQGNPQTLPQYDIGLIVWGATAQDPPLLLPVLPVLGSQLVHQGFHALIGRDILKTCVLVYNGQTGLFTVAF